MGNVPSVAAEQPDQFVVQSTKDFQKQLNAVLRSRPTFIKTVVLPPGVALDDSRLADAQIISEKRYTLEPGDAGPWPDATPFECDMDGKLLPPAWGKHNIPAHYAVYPDHRFKGSTCGLCELTARAKEAREKKGQRLGASRVQRADTFEEIDKSIAAKMRGQ